MKKHNLFSKSVMCLVAVAMSVSLFAGCGSKSSTSTGSSSTKQTTSQSSNKTSNSDERKTQIQESLKALVTAGTINQTQSDKILTALTTKPDNKSGDNKPPQDNGQNNNQNQQSNQQGNGQANSQGNDQNKGKSPLSKLVTDGVITQAQADAVMQKISANMPQKNNGQSTSNNSSQTSQSSN
ncbi:hypothetical protein Ccar_23340 [Clostridium carboxidivorans P7]|uniref:Lipoprotein n=1 Tax=Clostridium carboxidivorans P7 TaxID=536227 RepID=C6PNC1_9CLOT|nr:hypothetical protein [Clostridium carboxidivorans]AKN33594.1 hypothetical protein Ccar_23340 [Clostridium carboxidivorans P7]EET89242.1 hypothetical protein CcarbDRAFT_0288 [Clostridium carboxidivorans P7]EFG86818.1 lipoprotein, putative [Clostridium carboxidivorans P7]